MAFQDYKLILGSAWIGIDNFAEVIYTPLFWKSLLNSTIFAILILGLGFPAPIILALLLIIWSSIGPGCIIYLAALKSIPEMPGC